jgi:hypothetical protein
MPKQSLALFAALVALAGAWPLFAQESTPGLSPPAGLEVRDMPYDEGRTLLLSWNKMPYDGPETAYVVLRSTREGGPYEEVLKFPANSRYGAPRNWPFWAWRPIPDRHYVAVSVPPPQPVAPEKPAPEKPIPEKPTPPEKPAPEGLTFLKVAAVRGTERAESGAVSGIPRANWFNLPKLNNFIFTVIFSVIILWFIERAKKKKLFLRRIPGLDAVEEAIGRSTEMGKPIYYLTGFLPISSVPTIAATVILGEVAKKIARFETEIKVPHRDPVAMAVCQEMMKESYMQVGRPDAYNEDSNFFITDDQFGFAAAVDGLMMRDKPAACFYMGYYYAESLLFAEAGAAAGAIQVAGTDAEHQLPFFVTACDYTLIGEELYAVSAYLSGDPVLVGTLRGQDLGKALIMIAAVLGVLMATVGILINRWDWVAPVLDLYKSF